MREIITLMQSMSRLLLFRIKLIISARPPPACGDYALLFNASTGGELKYIVKIISESLFGVSLRVSVEITLARAV